MTLKNLFMFVLLCALFQEPLVYCPNFLQRIQNFFGINSSRVAPQAHQSVARPPSRPTTAIQVAPAPEPSAPLSMSISSSDQSPQRPRSNSPTVPGTSDVILNTQRSRSSSPKTPTNSTSKKTSPYLSSSSTTSINGGGIGSILAMQKRKRQGLTRDGNPLPPHMRQQPSGKGDPLQNIAKIVNEERQKQAQKASAKTRNSQYSDPF